jgi:ribokinase
MVPQVCVVGSCNMDLTAVVPRLPGVGETLPATAFLSGGGGKGANQAVMAARLGASVALVGKVGADLYGEQILRNLAKEDINTANVTTDHEHPSGLALILVDGEGRNCIVVVPGANAALTAEDVHRAAPEIGAAAVLLCQHEVPPEATVEALRIARSHGVKTILNPAPARPLKEEVLSMVDVLVPNEPELTQLTASPVRDRKETEAAARQLLRAGVGAVVVTRGERGCLVLDGKGVVELSGVAVTARDTSGAGDAFVATLGVALADGLPLVEAARRANVVAALSVTRPGTQGSFPRADEVDAFLARFL